MNPTKSIRTLVSLKLPRSVPALITLAKTIVTEMTGNQNFPTTDPPLPTVTGGINDLDTAEHAAVMRTKGAVAARNEKRAVLVQMLQGLKGTVQKGADANPEQAGSIIQSAGMSVRKQAAHKKRGFAVAPGAVTGTVKLTTASAGHRSSYEWQFSTDGGKTWQNAPSTIQAKTTILGLQPGATVYFRFRAVIKTGETDWSEPLSIIVK